MSIDYPGNVSGYGMIPPFPPSVIDLKGTRSVCTSGPGWAKSIPSKEVFTSSERVSWFALRDNP
jgi:hypothetical protein